MIQEKKQRVHLNVKDFALYLDVDIDREHFSKLCDNSLECLILAQSLSLRRLSKEFLNRRLSKEIFKDVLCVSCLFIHDALFFFFAAADFSLAALL